MFEDALRFPWSGDRNVERLIVGGGLTLIGFLFVPLLFVYGYLVRVVRLVALGERDEPPSFEDWGDLLVDGSIGFIISLVYLIVPIVTVGVAVSLVSFSVFAVGGSAGAGVGLLAVGGLLITLFVVAVALGLSIVALYLLPAGVAAFARTGRFGAAFDPGDLRYIATERRYAVGWLVAVGINFLAWVVAGTVTATAIGALLVPVVLFYGNVASAYAIGVGVSDIDVRESDGETVTGQPAV